MQNFNDLVKRYTIKNDYVIKKICAPLKDCLGVTTFTYVFITNDGGFGMISNNVGGLDFFINGKYYIQHPLMIHPLLLRSGCALLPSHPDPSIQDVTFKKYQIGSLFYILQTNGEVLEGGAFNVSRLSKDCAIFYLENLDLLTKFFAFFKREANRLLVDMKDDGFNIKKAKGELFLESNPSIPLSSKDPKASQFLKALSPLSWREYQCLEMYKKGHSAQSTAALLGLSKRTVEHYFENMKNKLNCNSKRDLLNF